MSPARGILQSGLSFRIFFMTNQQLFVLSPGFCESWFSIIEYSRLFYFEFIIDVDNRG